MIKKYIEIDHQYYSDKFSAKLKLIDNNLDDIVIKEDPIIEKEIIYIDKTVIIPRLKLRNYCSENNIKVTNDITKADKVYINMKTFRSKYVRTNHYYILPNEYKKELFEMCIKQTPDIGIEEIFAEHEIEAVLISAYDLKTISQFLIKIGASKEITDYITEMHKNHESDDDSKEITFTKIYDIEEKAYEELIYSGKLHNDAYLHKIINNGKIMDKEMYQNTRSLFLSEDEENHVLAMEVMANSDIEKSSVYLLLLYSEFFTEIYDSKYRTNISFKTLTKYFNITGGFNVTGIIDKLQAKKLLTISNLGVLIPMIEESAKNRLPYFEIGTIKPTKKVLDWIIESEIAQEVPVENIEDVCSRLTIDINTKIPEEEEEDYDY